MVPPRLVRRIVLAPLLIVIAAAVVVLFLPLALLALVVGLAQGSRPGRSRPVEPVQAQQSHDHRSARAARASRLGRLRPAAAHLRTHLAGRGDGRAVHVPGLWITSGFGGYCRPSRTRAATTRSWNGTWGGSTARR